MCFNGMGPLSPFPYNLGRTLQAISPMCLGVKSLALGHHTAIQSVNLDESEEMSYINPLQIGT